MAIKDVKIDSGAIVHILKTLGVVWLQDEKGNALTRAQWIPSEHRWEIS